MKLVSVFIVFLILTNCIRSNSNIYENKKTTSNPIIYNTNEVLNQKLFINRQFLDTTKNIKTVYQCVLDSEDDNFPLRLIDTIMYYHQFRHTNRDVVLLDSFSCYFDGYVSEYFFLQLNKFNNVQLNIIIDDMFLLSQSNKIESCLESNFILCYSMYGERKNAIQCINNHLENTTDKYFIIYLNSLKQKLNN